MNSFTIRPELSWALVIVLFCAFIALALSFQAGLFALLFAGIAWYIWRDSEYGFLLFLVLLPILPMLKITQTIGTASLVKDVIIITLFVRLVAVPLLTKSLPYRRNVLFAPVVALSLWAVIATVQADSLILGVLRLRDIGLYIMLYFAVLYLPSHSAVVMKRRFMWAGITVLVTLLLAGWQWFFSVDSAVLRFDPVQSIWIPRISSILAHPSIYGQYLIAAATLFASSSIVIRNGRSRVLFAILTALLLPAIFLTYSRAVWLGMAAATGAIGLLFLWKTVRANISLVVIGRWFASSMIVGVIVLIVLLRTTPAGGLLRSAIDPTYGSNEERVTFLVRLIAPTTSAQAVFGRGLGDVLEQNFRQVDLETYDIAAGDSRAVQLTKNRTLVDNQYLKTFVELGVIGIVLYLWLYWRLALHATRSAAATERGILRPLVGYWCIGFLAAFTVQAFFIDIWDVFPTNALFWVAAAHLSVLQTT